MHRQWKKGGSWQLVSEWGFRCCKRSREKNICTFAEVKAFVHLGEICCGGGSEHKNYEWIFVRIFDRLFKRGVIYRLPNSYSIRGGEEAYSRLQIS